MAENLIIRLRADGALKVVRNFKNIGDSGRQAANGVGILQRALGLLGGVLAIRSVIQYSDAYTSLQNRLKLVTKSSAELGVVTEELRKTANETRTAFSNTGEFYARAALASRELGVSQRQLLDLTRSVNQAIILSGATAVEAEKGLIQFSQGIASGSLRGDELRSVLEQLPLVADVIAKQLGVTRGALRKLGATGAITAEVILEAFKNSRDELEFLFKTTVPTIQQSFAVLRNEVVIFIGRLNAGTGAAQTFSEIVLALAKNIDIFVRIIAAGGIALALNAIRNGIVGITAAILANPIGLIVTGLTLATSALIAFSSQLMVAEGSFTTFQDVGVEALKTIVFELGFFVKGVVLAVQDVNDNFELLDFRSLAFGIARIIDVIINSFKVLAETVASSFRTTVAVLTLLLDLDKLAGFSATVGAARKGGASIAEALDLGFRDQFGAGFLDFGDRLAGILEGTRVEDAVDGVFDRANQRATKRQIDANRRAFEASKVNLEDPGVKTATVTGGKAPKLTVAQVLAQLEQEGRLLQLNNREREREEQLLRIVVALRKAGAQFDLADVAAIDKLITRNQLLADQASLYEEIKGPLQQHMVQVEALNILYDSGRINLDEFNNKLAELNRKILETDNSISGAGKGLLAGFIQPAQSLFQSLEQTGIGTLQSFGDALSETFRRGGNIGDFFESFKAGLSDVLGQLAQLTFRLLLIQSITALGGGGFLASIGVSPVGKAFGGTVQGGREGRVMRVGERGPENVFVGPGQQANVQPVQQQAPQQVNVIAVADPNDVPAFLNSVEGGHTIVQLVSRNRSQIRAALGV